MEKQRLFFRIDVAQLLFNVCEEVFELLEKMKQKFANSQIFCSIEN